MARRYRPDAMEPRGSIGTPRVTVHLVRASTRLVTFQASNPDPLRVDVKGAIVKVEPVSGMSTVEREAMRADLLKRGAAHVWFTAQQAGASTVTKRSLRAAPPQKVETMNEAIEEMLKGVRSENPARLRELVERFLSEAGA